MTALLDPYAADFARRALLEVVLVGVLCGVVGVHVVLRRLSFFAMTMAHATFPGVVLAALLGVPLLLGAGAFGVVVVLLVVAVGAQRRVDSTTAVGVVLAGGFALGVTLLATSAGFSRDLAAFLVGSLVTVQEQDLVLTALGGLAVLVVLAALHKELVLAAFDPAALAAAGYRPVLLDLALLLCLQLVLVACVPAVGTFLSVALLAAPAAAARLWTDSTAGTMAVSVGLAVLAGVTGLTVSLHADVAAGASVVLVAAGLLLVSLLVGTRSGPVRALRRRRAAASAAPAPATAPDGAAARA